ncbi:amidohydrolase [Runella slithyformis]|uniref:Amidohydrolase n=1 Tax=Runella slithyformis (strain ATCC 29530 / DSM 19594 / LMG 11500 / NCIMB 11436 / LSU 4) TaxID=761193 RepID=A0A7U3ZGD0_RUNSL|nr:amidohydrolase [Runella slithyformis]AEI46731.1 amidohydrolase [Runella slithyformis DSM 19594]
MKIYCTLFLVLATAMLRAQTSSNKDHENAIKEINQKEKQYGAMAKQIWNYAEVGYQEVKSSALLQAELRKEGFKVQAGVADIPTAFVATFGEGKPVIGILGEFDALPGLSQDSLPVKKAIGGIAGHACGHHLFGVASMASAIAVKNWLTQSGHKGTVRFYGTPAEEGGAGKIYMVRAGLFNDVDVVLHWHPGDGNSANPSSSLANKSAKFRFHGISAHAAGAPERGRSALDGVEVMNYAVNMMREHVPSASRIHYVITNGGKAPNVVPDFAEVYYTVRHPSREYVVSIWERVQKAAQGAALATGTTVDEEVISGVHELLPNEVLAQVMYKNLKTVGGVKYTPEEVKFAEQISTSQGMGIREIASAAQVDPLSSEGGGGGSTDVGDVSWAVPTVGLRTATWVPGTPAHSWQAVAAGGMSIGRKGMIVAAKTLALTAIDLFQDEKTIAEAKAEFEKRRGPGFQYKALIGDRKPALNYRD